VVAVLSLGLAIGAATVAFAVLDGLVFRKLAVTQPERLVYFRQLMPPRSYDELSVPILEQVRKSAPFSSVAATNTFDRANIAISGTNGGLDPASARVAIVTGSYFETLGVPAALGRAFSRVDDGAFGAPAVALISDAYWQRRLNRAGDVMQRTLTLNGTSYDIIGVMPAGFNGDWVGRPADIWVPFAMHQQVLIEQPGPLTKPNDMWLHILARLKPGVSIEQAGAALQLTWQRHLRDQLGAGAAPDDLKRIAENRLELVSAERGYSQQRDALLPALRILAIVVGLVLLIACANVASLLLARAAARQRELAVRLAIGAGSGRIMRQLVTESVLLAALGGIAGLGFAFWGTRAFARTIVAGPVGMFWGRSTWISFDLAIDGRTIVFTIALSIGAGLLLGVAPALRSAALRIAPNLIGRGASSGSALRFGAGKALVSAQVALSLIVLIAAGLFVRTLRNLESQDLGFEKQNLLLVWTQPSATGRNPQQLRELWGDVQRRLSALPGVSSAAATNQGIVTGAMPALGPIGNAFRIPGRPAKPTNLGGYRSYITPRFFETMGVPLIAGREFTELDTDARPRVVIISESMARHYFGSENPIGQQVMIAGDTVGPTEIIGVVKNFVPGTPRGAELHQHLTYYSYRDRESQRRLQIMMVAVRTSDDPHALIPAVRAELQRADASLAVLKIDTVEEQLADVLAQDRLIAGLGTFFGSLALLLACLGLYGVIAYTTSRRTSEIGIRMALGASDRSVLRLVLREGLTLVMAGIAIGLPLTLLTSRWVSSRLYGIQPGDPVTIAGAAVLLVGVASMAGYIPARRAARVDPLIALQDG
jgi:predicted permease